MARYFAVLLAVSGLVSAAVHPLPNLTDMTGGERTAITAVCVIGGIAIWFAPWDRWPRWTLFLLPPIGLGVKMWANLLGGLGPYAYAVHFVLIYTWMGISLPRWSPLAFSPLLVVAYVVPLWIQGDPRQTASVGIVGAICVVIGESVAWISNRLREAERSDGRRMQWMNWLVEAGSDLARQRDLRDVLERITHLATELPGSAGAAVLIPAPGRDLDVAESLRWPGSLPERFRLLDEPALLEPFRSGETLGRTDPDCVELQERLGVAHLGIAPLPGSARCAGIVLLARRAGVDRLDPFTQKLVQTLSRQAGLAIERVQTRDALRDASLHDELTGVGNRRKANERLERLLPGDAIMLIDLDHFKRVNDTHGHAEGDRVLRQLADFLLDAARESDEVFRMGGEEFLMVLEQAGPGAGLAAERICESWRLLDALTTFSAGVSLHGAEWTYKETLAEADVALYQAKAAGRDRVMGG